MISQLSKKYLGLNVLEILLLLITFSVLIILGWALDQKLDNNAIFQADSVNNQSKSNTFLQQNSSKHYWIISASAINELAINPVALSKLQNSTIYVPLRSSSVLVAQTKSLNIIPTETFTNESTLAQAIASHKIIKGTKAILYDNEPWPLTPKAQQLNPKLYYQIASNITTQAGYTFIASPVSIIDPRIDAQIAPEINVLDIQSQYDQTIPTVYADHVLPIAISAHKANPKLIVLSGLSTNPPAGIPTARQLVNDADAVKNQVQGFWLNIPSKGKACPKCHIAQPQIGIQFLSELNY